MGSASSKPNGLNCEGIKTIEENDSWIQKKGSLKINVNAGLPDSEYCVFLDKSRSSDSPLQRNLKNLMLYRHPNILKFVSSFVFDEQRYMVTEVAYPLMNFKNLDSSEIVVGLHDVAQAMKFLHEMARCVHGPFGLHTIYVSKDGTWKLGRLENLVKMSDAAAEKNLTPVDFENYFNLVENISNNASDANNWFLSEFLNLRHLRGDDISWNRILDHTFFENCKFLQLRNFLQNFVVKSKEDKEKFFCSLSEDIIDNVANNLTSQLCELLLSRVVVLDPSASNFLAFFINQFNFEMADARSKNIIENIIQPRVLTMFRVRDTQVRLFLLNNFNSIVRVFTPVQLQTSILPELLLGIKDTNPEIVEHTLRALASLVPILGVCAVIGAKNRSKIFSESRPVIKNCGIANEFAPSKNECCTRLPPDGVENDDELWTSFDDNWTQKSGEKSDINLVEKTVEDNNCENSLSQKPDAPAVNLSRETENNNNFFSLDNSCKNADPIDDLFKDMEPVLSKPQVLIVDQEEPEKIKVRFRVGSMTDEEDGWGDE